ncbi:hypothetical protein Lqui_1075 [Legionella quinlivanii]|uniref:UPF0235 protein Lqui_1075 n=1 Tax=Legionella quinlivanii TaxID=45073 RepID=A0A0W0Y5H6_9GAMM|nr:DUF167 domain-containing protein [Legionella quinlivanii]KTD52231.1 hypothetical protein Lqui_1075 [Legionella quinlivanii]MCW8452495.1 DUF167 domain-containing protein [Legionella quinlivanii]SEF75008.1 hypothetical protein SAMN02746093_00978 [Legionella quinlivanii DSM 21216]STY12270.1 Uncharacterised ACR, YggU family COG1872 [Legionella quinlivanii]
MNESWYQLEEGKLILSLYIQPGAKKSEICGLHGQSLKIKLAAPPVEGKANKALIKFLAQSLNVPLAAISIRHGEKSRMKTVIIQGGRKELVSALVPHLHSS